MSELRLARKADALAIHALLRAARHEIGLNWKGNDDWYVKWIEDHCKRRTVWVVESDKEIAGAMLMLMRGTRFSIQLCPKGIVKGV